MSNYKPAKNKGLEWIEEEFSHIKESSTENTLENHISINQKNENINLPTTQKGLQDGWTRATFIVKKRYLEDLKNMAYWDRETIKDVLDGVLESFFRDKTIPKRKRKVSSGRID